jgi:hypothetical protein
VRAFPQLHPAVHANSACSIGEIAILDPLERRDK